MNSEAGFEDWKNRLCSENLTNEDFVKQYLQDFYILLSKQKHGNSHELMTMGLDTSKEKFEDDMLKIVYRFSS
tara:strand:- start:12054 stop:12272 length:219 start_codon:yes stop_codon:yes gene_type:complete